jgi:hypothetical protein
MTAQHADGQNIHFSGATTAKNIAASALPALGILPVYRHLGFTVGATGDFRCKNRPA